MKSPTNFIYQYHCFKCELFFHSPNPMAACPCCGAETHTICTSVFAQGEWESLVGNESLCCLRFLDALAWTEKTGAEQEDPQVFSC